MAQLLLAHGADPDPRAADGATPMILAEVHEHRQIAELLHRYGIPRVKIVRPGQ